MESVSYIFDLASYSSPIGFHDKILRAFSVSPSKHVQYIVTIWIYVH